MTKSNKVRKKDKIENLSKKGPNIWKNRKKNIYLNDKKLQTSQKSDKFLKKSGKKSQTSKK